MRANQSDCQPGGNSRSGFIFSLFGGTEKMDYRVSDGKGADTIYRQTCGNYVV